MLNSVDDSVRGRQADYLRAWRARRIAADPVGFRERERARYRARRAANLEEERAKGRIKARLYRQRHPDQSPEQKSKARAAVERFKLRHPKRWAEQLRRAKLKYRAGGGRERELAYYKSDEGRAKRRLYLRQYRERAEARERIAANARRYVRTENGRCKMLERGRQRRARLRMAPGTITVAQWRAIVERYEMRCVYCGEVFDPFKLTMDHVVPLCKGGAHDPSNVVPACRSCNSRKGPRTLPMRLKLA